VIGSDHLAFVAGAGFLLLPAIFGIQCDDKEVELVRFNADDAFTVQITADEVGEAQTIDLTSSSGNIVVGTATLDPGSGPVNTDHELVVRVGDAFEREVWQVTLYVDSGERGGAEFELSQDSADEGYWWVDLRSVGEVGETRVDTFEVRLWTPGVDGADTGDDDTGDDTGGDT